MQVHRGPCRLHVVMETAVTMEDHTDVTMVNKMAVQDSDKPPSSDQEPQKPASDQPRRRPLVRRSQRAKRRSLCDKRRSQRTKRRGQEEKKEGVTVKRTWSGGKRRWDKKHYCVFCRRPQVKIARHLLRKHGDEQEVVAASTLPPGSKQRHLLLEHLRCRGNYLHNIEVIRQGSGEIIPWRQPSEEVDARNYLPCPLCLGFFLRADLWKHQVSCRKKLAINPSKDSASSSETSSDPHNSESTGRSGCDPAHSGTSKDPPVDPPGEANQRSSSRSKRPLTSDPSLDQNLIPDSAGNRPRKRTRVQAAASRLLPISSGASESCSEILHRMNQDSVSYEVKSDWLICKYGNKLMGNQDGSQRRYDYVSQKLRELGRLLLAAKSLDTGVQNLQDLLSPGRISLALSAARKASGYRWSRPPLAVKTTLKTVCEIAIGESLEDGDWEAAAKTTDFYHMLGREWDNLGLQNPGSDPAASEGAKGKKHPVQSKNEKDLRPDGLFKNGTRPLSSALPSDSRLQNPVSVPAGPRKVRRRPWSSAEKEAIWRQLGDHVLFQSVPGKEVCQRCLDLEPVLRGRHWKDIKNQIHNQIQSQKKQQFHAQMDLEENQDHRDQIQNHSQEKQQLQYQTEMDPQQKDHQNQKKQQYLSQMDQQDNGQNQKRPSYHIQMNHQDGIQNQKNHLEHTQLDHQDHLHMHKKQLCHNRLDHQDHQDPSQILKKQLYQMDQQTQPLQTLDRDTSVLTVSPYGPEGPLRPPGLPLLERDPAITPYPLLHRAPGPHMEQLLSRPDWTEEALAQNYSIGRSLGRNLLQDVPPGGPAPDPHSGHVHF
ncbi:uncharacterized protein LOC121640119 isoform X4 [Melanotaenia boesemani]|uniref:uncharacterized protein LOC121640119 isoform X3 n=1 Tax=Melanotaenia boesemani TaxID=1250792 RepID=UPI001C056894|nr:uncharacterized protein LOC121640119 isoform X3 [Melanotaenia boesemani]XP_041841693.1 uncharacterized protein LOC121640119 isoform X4 [Melanotaenia boesemani]